MDEAGIAAAAAGVPLVVTVEEHTVIGGLGGLVAEIVTAHDPRPLIRIGIEDTWGKSAPNAWLLERHGLTPERVASACGGCGVGAEGPQGRATVAARFRERDVWG